MVAIIVISALAFLLVQARKEVHGLLKIDEARLEILLSRADALTTPVDNIVVVDGPGSATDKRVGEELFRQFEPLDGQITIVTRALADGSISAALSEAIKVRSTDIVNTDGRFVIRSGQLIAVLSDGRATVIATVPLVALVSALRGRLTMELIAVVFLGVLLYLVRESRLSDYSIRRLLDASPVPLVLIDLESGVLQFANRAAFSLFPERHPRTLLDLQTSIQTQGDLMSWLLNEGASGDDMLTQEFEIPRVSGSSGWVIVSRQWVLVHGCRLVIASLADITVRHEAEVALKRAKEQAEALGRMRSESIAMISHELRTPVNGIVGLAQLVSEHSLAEPTARIVRRMVQAGRTLAVIINDFVDVAMLDLGQVRLDRRVFDPRETVLAAVSLVSAGQTCKGLDIRVRCTDILPAFVFGDPDRLQQIVINLVGNSMKFTDAGYIELDIAMIILSANAIELRVDVKDTGIGMPADLIPRLFQPFSQGETGPRKRFGGAGLGLAICKRLAEAMGGSIAVDSQVGKGSTFHVRLPFDLANETREARQATRVRILVVDDVALNRDVVADLLRLEGCEVETAKSGRDAIEQITASGFDTVLMDIRMPDMDGLATTAAIRASPVLEVSRLPILGFTANILPTDRPLYRLRGIDEIVEKPLDFGKLKSAIERNMVPGNVDAGGPPPRLEYLVRSLGPIRTQQIVSAFAAVAGEAIEAIVTSCSALDFVEVAEAAHRLSGAASNVGFDELAAAAAFLEEVALIGPPTGVSQAADVTVMRFKEAGLVVKAFTLDL